VEDTRAIRVQLERSLAGRVVLTVVMAVLLASLVLWNLPNGKPRQEARDLVRPVLLPLGLDQDWSVFAPNPRAFSVGFLATVTYEDGRQRTWRPPETGLWLAPFRTYRWQKYNERVRADDFSGIWLDAARYVARDAGPGVVTVQLLREFRPVVVPGSGEQTKPLQVAEFYRWDRP